MKTTFVVTIAVLLALIVTEADCIGARPKNAKRSKMIPQHDRRSLCAVAREMKCDRELAREHDRFE
ncbi:hypothetical protein P5673_031160 [Acropora cervicornis]|uniref:Uncharacterized protein n=1 Tax=Acropora cervicornis TaxID=6130 RepID=A0AAD9PU09_ACRCE|nr:hypothetical protein P5673_031160 [Acropora cervicornis]